MCYTKTMLFQKRSVFAYGREIFKIKLNGFGVNYCFDCLMNGAVKRFDISFAAKFRHETATRFQSAIHRSRYPSRIFHPMNGGIRKHGVERLIEMEICSIGQL